MAVSGDADTRARVRRFRWRPRTQPLNTVLRCLVLWAVFPSVTGCTWVTLGIDISDSMRIWFEMTGTYRMMTIVDGNITERCKACPNITGLQTELDFVNGELDFIEELRSTFGNATKGGIALQYTFFDTFDPFGWYMLDFYSDVCDFTYTSRWNETRATGTKAETCVNVTFPLDKSNALSFEAEIASLVQKWCRIHVALKKLNSLETAKAAFWYQTEDGKNVTKCSIITESRMRVHPYLFLRDGAIKITSNYSYVDGGVNVTVSNDTVPGAMCLVYTVWWYWEWSTVIANPTPNMTYRTNLSYSDFNFTSGEIYEITTTPAATSIPVTTSASVSTASPTETSVPTIDGLNAFLGSEAGYFFLICVIFLGVSVTALYVHRREVLMCCKKLNEIERRHIRLAFGWERPSFLKRREYIEI